MRKAMMSAAVAAGVLAASAAWASGPLPVIAVVDKVVPASESGPPKSVEVWGTFVVLEGGDLLKYGMPHYGYYHYTAVEGKEEECGRDWKEMQKYAGTGTVLGWGNGDDPRHAGELHSSQAKPGKGDPYPLAYGVLKFRADSTFDTVQRLRTIPAPVAPAEDSQVPAGKVNLVVRNVRDKASGWRYVFALEHGGTVEKSEPLAAGEEETTWTPKTEIKAGENYVWHVQAMHDRKDTKPSTARFTGK
jgi:hypothetical protein